MSQLVCTRQTRIAFIGDSITAGGAYDAVYTRARGFYRGGSALYPASITAGTVAPALPGGLTYVNAGVSGNKAEDVNLRIQADVLNLVPLPDLLFIAVGVNDCSGSTNINAFSTSYAGILAKAIAAGIPPSQIGTISVWLLGENVNDINNPDTYRTAINSKNAAILAAAQAVGAVPVDVRTPTLAWEAIHNPGNTDTGILLDGTAAHPSTIGKAYLCDILFGSNMDSPATTYITMSAA